MLNLCLWSDDYASLLTLISIVITLPPTRLYNLFYQTCLRGSRLAPLLLSTHSHFTGNAGIARESSY
jgi:hypothetical protein